MDLAPSMSETFGCGGDTGSNTQGILSMGLIAMASWPLFVRNETLSSLYSLAKLLERRLCGGLTPLVITARIRSSKREEQLIHIIGA